MEVLRTRLTRHTSTQAPSPGVLLLKTCQDTVYSRIIFFDETNESVANLQ